MELDREVAGSDREEKEVPAPASKGDSDSAVVPPGEAGLADSRSTLAPWIREPRRRTRLTAQRASLKKRGDR